MTRVTLVISRLGVGGAERVAATMANHWAQAGRAVSVVTLDGRPPFYALDPRVRHERLGLLADSTSPLDAAWSNLRRVLALRRTLRRLCPEGVVSFVDETNVLTLLAARGLGVPVVVTVHSDPFLIPLDRAWGWLRQWTYGWARAIVVLNERARRFFAARVATPVTVLPNPVSVPAAGPASRRGEAAGRWVVAMGRLGPEKRFDVLLDAFARLAPRHPQWRLLLLGDGPLRGALEARRDRLGLTTRVDMPGAVAEPHALLSACDLFVLSSETEGFPMALCEAMACGLAAIATEYHEGVREIVRDGVDAVLVPPRDPDALAAAMDRLMADDAARRRLAACAVEVRERFGPERVMALWDALLACPAPAGP